MVKITKENSLGRNFLYSAIVTIIIGLVNMVYPVIIGLIYNAELIGYLTILLNWIALFSIPIQNGISPAISRFLAASEPEEAKSLEGLGFKLSTFYIILVFILFPFLSFFIFKLNVKGFFIVLILLVLIIFHYLIRKSLQGQEKYYFLVKIEIIAFVMFIIFFVIFIILPKIFVWSNFYNEYVFCIPIIIYHIIFDGIYFVLRVNDIKSTKMFKLPLITKNILIYAFMVSFGSFLGIGLSKIQIIISQLYITQFEVGVLSFWSNVTAPLSLLTITLNAILVPRVTNLKKFKEEIVNPFIEKINWSLSLTIVPIMDLMFLLIVKYPTIIDLLTLSKYETEFYWPIIILFSFHGMINLLSAPILSFFAASEKKVLFNLIYSVIYSILTIISWFLLVPVIGVFGFVAGIAIGALFANIFILIVLLIISRGQAGKNLFFLLANYGLIAFFLFIIEEWLQISIICWAILTVVLVIIGIRFFIKILKEKEYSYRYNSKNVMI
ncbi:MAG: hypothetical protein ACTSUL_01025 [Promethearchaeota archaeon]